MNIFPKFLQTEPAAPTDQAGSTPTDLFDFDFERSFLEGANRDEASIEGAPIDIDTNETDQNRITQFLKALSVTGQDAASPPVSSPAFLEPPENVIPPHSFQPDILPQEGQTNLGDPTIAARDTAPLSLDLILTPPLIDDGHIDLESQTADINDKTMAYKRSQLNFGSVQNLQSSTHPELIDSPLLHSHTAPEDIEAHIPASDDKAPSQSTPGKITHPPVSKDIFLANTLATDTPLPGKDSPEQLSKIPSPEIISLQATAAELTSPDAATSKPATPASTTPVATTPVATISDAVTSDLAVIKGDATPPKTDLPTQDFKASQLSAADPGSGIRNPVPVQDREGLFPANPVKSNTAIATVNAPASEIKAAVPNNVASPRLTPETTYIPEQTPKQTSQQTPKTMTADSVDILDTTPDVTQTKPEPESLIILPQTESIKSINAVRPADMAIALSRILPTATPQPAAQLSETQDIDIKRSPDIRISADIDDSHKLAEHLMTKDLDVKLHKAAPAIIDSPKLITEFSTQISPLTPPASEVAAKPAQSIRPSIPTTHPAILTVAQMLVKTQETKSGISVRLDPPEMGRVFIDFQFETERGVTAIIRSEVAETAVILKDKAEFFQQILKDGGFESVNLSFEDNNQSKEKAFNFDQDKNAEAQFHIDQDVNIEAAPAAHLPKTYKLTPDNHIDIKL